MKKLLWLTTMLLWLFGLYSCNDDFALENANPQQQDLNASFTADNIVQGQLIIKLAKEPAEVKIVQTRSGDSQVETGIKTIDEICASIGASSMKRVFPPAGKFEARTREAGLHLWYVVEFPEEISLTRTAFDFNNSEDIVFVEPVHFIKAPSGNKKNVSGSDPMLQNVHTRSSTMPFNDPKLVDQWHYKNTGNLNRFVAGADINVFEAWTKTVGHPDVIVAVVDGGIEYSHEDLAANMWVNTGEIPNNGIDDDRNGRIDDYYGYNFYNNSPNIAPSDHGTFVAGIIGAVNNNGRGVSGIAGGNHALNQKGVRLMSCQALNQEGNGTTAGLVSAIKYGADNGAVICQISTGGYTYVGAVKAAIDHFISYAGMNEYGTQTGPMRGGIVFAAAGNDNTQSMIYPAGFPNVIAVASIGPNFQRAYDSNYGSWVDIAAPGGAGDMAFGDVYSTTIGGEYTHDFGTSYACPHVSGVAALVLSKAVTNGISRSMSPTVLKDILYAACKSDRLYGYNNHLYYYLGKGLINADLAVNSMSPPTTIPTIIGPSNLVEGARGVFKLNWGDYLPGDYYTVEWWGPFLDITPYENGMGADVRCFAGGGTYTITADIKGKYNGYHNQVSCNIEVDEITGDFGRFEVVVYSSARMNLNFTLHNANIENKFMPPGSGGGAFASHLSPGAYRFRIDLTSRPGSTVPYDNIYFDGYITTRGARLELDIEDIGIRLINFQTASPHPSIYRWFYEEGTGYGYF